MLTLDDPSCSALSSVIWQSHSNDNNDTQSQCRYSDPIIKSQECHWGCETAKTSLNTNISARLIKEDSNLNVCDEVKCSTSKCYPHDLNSSLLGSLISKTGRSQQMRSSVWSNEQTSVRNNCAKGRSYPPATPARQGLVMLRLCNLNWTEPLVFLNCVFKLNQWM